MQDIQDLWERKRRLDSIRKWTVGIVSGVFALVLLTVGLPWWVLLLIMMPIFIAVLNMVGFLMLPHYFKLKRSEARGAQLLTLGHTRCPESKEGPTTRLSGGREH